MRLCVCLASSLCLASLLLSYVNLSGSYTTARDLEEAPRVHSIDIFMQLP